MPQMGRLVSGVFCLLMLLRPAFARKPETGFLNRMVQVGGVAYRYQVYLPNEWNKHQRWPVILFLHGIGERGDDGIRGTQIGIAGAIRQNPERFPFIVVFPQCRAETYWFDSKMQRQALKALDESIKEFHGDKRRVYLTGLSMGGYGVWDVARKNPGKFAAVAPVCGGIARAFDQLASLPKSANMYDEVAKQIGRTPVWVFHGEVDPAVPVVESRRMVEALKAAGGDVRYSEYPGVGHNSWDKAYNEPDFIPWLLVHQSPQR